MVRPIKNKGLKKKVLQVVDAARQAPIALRPSSVVLFFSNGLDDNVCKKLRREFGGVSLDLMDAFSYKKVDLDDEWLNVVLGRSFSKSRVVEIKVDKDDAVMDKKDALDSTSMNRFFLCKKFKEYSDSNLGKSLCSLVSGMKCWCCSSDDSLELEFGSAIRMLGESQFKLVNFDTTAMVAIVSGISNGRTEKLLATPESELRGRFKGHYEFVIAQVISENQSPIHHELSGVLSEKRGIICETVIQSSRISSQWLEDQMRN